MAGYTEKKWYESKTIWLNVVGFIIIGLQLIQNVGIPLDPEAQALILAVLNFLLRFKTENAIERSIK